MADFLAAANLAQVGFIAQLISNYLSDVACHVPIGRVMIRAACQKIKEVRYYLHISEIPLRKY